MGLDQLWAGWRYEYVTSATDLDRDAGNGGCVFCRIKESGGPSDQNGVLWRGQHSFAVMNLYPYTSGHILVLPNRHESDVNSLSREESIELWDTALCATRAIEAAFKPDGMNLGANLGRAAGAGIPLHLHLHVLPRWSGDTNFMTPVANTRVISESFESTWARLHAAWPNDR